MKGNTKVWRVLLLICGLVFATSAFARSSSPEQIVQIIGQSSVIEEVKSQPQTLWLAYAIYREARGEPEAGQHAVGHVILNRVRNSGLTIFQTIWQPGQFPWVRHGINKPGDTEIWAKVQKIAIQTLVEADNTHGATQFYGRHDCACRFRGTVVTAIIGGHTFVKPKKQTTLKIIVDTGVLIA